jgi:(E)-4-hydroxy-3-methylbut-2-enyl-diphosphate synthase
MIKRKITRQIDVGGVKIGGGASVSIQSMVKTETRDVNRCVAEIKALEEAGCEIVRVAVKTFDDAAAVKAIKRKIKVPLVCDIHFNYVLALKSIESGADKIRLNPGNIDKKEEIAKVVKAAKLARIPVRIGVNSGSSPVLVEAALRYIKIFERMDFRDIIISLKASDVVRTVEAYRKMSAISKYPLHLGVTAAGPYDSGVVKSAIGIGSLLLDGIGDTIRVSLTANPVEEVIAAKRILGSLGLRRFGPEVISCPTCGRCQVDLGKIVREIEAELGIKHYTLHKRPIKIAIMGCEVNGPGEAKEADIGIAFGKDSGMMFKKGKMLKKVSIKKAVTELFKYL